MALPQTLIVSVSGIRGRVGVDLDPGLVADCAAAFGSYVRGQGWGDHLAVARDSRPSGPALARAATAGLMAVGCRVSDLGLVPTPTALLAIEENGLAGGIVVTASHNPKEWNALKLAGPDGAFLTPEQGAEFLPTLESGDRPGYLAGDGAFGSADPLPGAIDRHIAAILALPLVDPDVVAARGFRLVVDCTRGAGGVILPGLLDRLGCEVEWIDREPDGRFTREPEPIPQNMTALCEAVREHGADLGMAVDPDVDRLALVDEEGRAIGEDYTLALAAKLALAHRIGPVVANLSTGQIVEAVAEEAGAEYRQTPVGEANVAAGIRAAGAVIGGEGNGGVILPGLHLTRDAPLAAALVLQLLAETGADLAETVAAYPQFCIVKDRFDRPDVQLRELFGWIEEAFGDAEIDRRDGLHLRWRDRRMWLHCRPSGTEPILRVIAEGPADKEADVRELVAAAGAIVQDRDG
ncbi:MAG: phosphoglucosamine mutase [Gemmatimonadetes bacterium]|uniref:Phosphoglucosamine mutase n=1 Tax=Candidatus Kutchimonas denitrificans TaxID=3056748 RepID=A0AAE5CCA7_9BACT|nr:phosphoglucosamine mutase [Gemmatimonadota bacterium]NIR75603.1 phosphoglucosamine mutase [Candidatus Kutchimonas denitrificans]NIS01917.1 phosphoglucosamine mutase [Gemmatimonadota bacterium]NIT67698.1 phosphoglucosamine mutase [Gemmatimonadota bacterium]NIU53572.1 phosphoglucosamine mutase [Gemmatimonadota bacterium]